MLKDLYPINKYPFEKLLLKNNYELNEETYMIFIHNKYCYHVSKKNEICKRRAIDGDSLCVLHSKKKILQKNKCNYILKNCSPCQKNVLTNQSIFCHLRQPFFQNATYQIYDYLVYEENSWQNINIKNVKILAPCFCVTINVLVIKFAD